MKNRSMRAWLIVALILMIGILGWKALLGNKSQSSVEEVAQTSQVQMGSVVVVKQDIDARTELLPEMIEVQQWEAEDIHPLALTSLEDAIGKITLIPMNAGEQLFSSKIADPDVDFLSYQLKEGYVAYTVPVSELTAAGGMIRVGDRVNVLGSFTADISGTDQSDFLLYDIPVIAIGKDMGINHVANEESFSSMTLEVLPEEAQSLAFAQNHGTVTFILKSVLDNNEGEELVAVTAKTIFGETKEYSDLEYLEMINKINTIREAENSLLEKGQGDLQQIRKILDYDRFYYDNLNPESEGK